MENSRKIVYIEGDGIGREVMPVAREVIDLVTGGTIHWVEARAGLACFEDTGTPLPPETLDLLREHRVGFKGPCNTPKNGGFRSVNVQMRLALGLSASIRPVWHLPRVPKSQEGLDIIFVREPSEGLYTGGAEILDEGRRVRVFGDYTMDAFAATVRQAFLLARVQGRRSVTLSLKSNILKEMGELLEGVFHGIGADFPNIQRHYMHIDALAMKLVLRPSMFDVVVTTNLFGDIITDLGAGLMGGEGVAPGACIGSGHALFEAVHGSADAPETGIAGQGIADPSAVMFSGVMMLNHIDLAEEGARMRRAVEQAICLNPTRDLGGSATTRAFTDTVIAQLT